MKPSNTIIVSPKYIEEKENQIADLSKKVGHLQEQLEEKDKLIEKLKKDKKDCKRCAFNCFHQMQSEV